MKEKIKLWIYNIFSLDEPLKLNNLMLALSIIFLTIPLFLIDKNASESEIVSTIVIYVIGVISSIIVWKK